MTNYPNEIYICTADNREITDPIGRADREKAYDLGKAAADSLEGWSNLTAAIQDGVNIDWEKLDGVEAQCVHPELGALTYKLERDAGFPEDSPEGWYGQDPNIAWAEAFYNAWNAQEGWNLYIKGETPLKPKTADQLPLGMCFKGQTTWVSEGASEPETFEYAQIIQPSYASGPIAVLYQRNFAPAGLYLRLDEIEVLEEYGIGTFKSPDE